MTLDAALLPHRSPSSAHRRHMVDGAFSETTRRYIVEACEYRCVGCGSGADLTIQHRRARGMGGTTNPTIAEIVNGLVLCGSGTTGCHGWAEAHPILAELLGWRLAPGTPADGSAWWHWLYGWVCWRVHPDGFVSRGWMDDGQVDRFAERKAAVREYRTTL